LECLKHPVSDTFEAYVFKPLSGKRLGLGISLAYSKNKCERVSRSPMARVSHETKRAAFLNTFSSV
jgi:hypothetical protein